MMGQARATLADGMLVNVSIESMTLHCTHMIPDQITPIPRTVVLSIHPLSVVMSGVNASVGSSTHMVSVPPSTDRLWVGLNLQTAGATCAIQDGASRFDYSIEQLQCQYAGITLPQSAYSNGSASNPTREIVKPYTDYLAASGRMYTEASSYDTVADWGVSPLWGFSFEKQINDTSTTVQVRMTRTNVVGFESQMAILQAANLVVAAQSHVAVVLTYGEDGLISSCDSVVQL